MSSYTEFCYSHIHPVCNAKGCNANLDDVRYRTCSRCREADRERKRTERLSHLYVIDEIESVLNCTNTDEITKLVNIKNLIEVFKNEQTYIKSISV